MPVQINYTAEDCFSPLFDAQSGDGYVNLTADDCFDIADQFSLMGIPEDKVALMKQPITATQDLLDSVEQHLLSDKKPELITLKFENEVIENVYAPALFSAKDKESVDVPVLKIGNNLAVIRQDGAEFTIGGDSSLGTCSLRYAIVSAGDSSYTAVRFHIKAKDWIYTIPCVLGEDFKDFTQDDIEEHLASGKPFAAILRPITSGSTFVKLRDLDLGEYGIKAILEPENAKYSRFLIQLDDGSKVSPNSALSRQLEASARLFEDLDVFSTFYSNQVLKIINKEYRQSAKGEQCFVTCKFVKRTDSMLGSSQPNTLPECDAKTVEVDAFPV